MKHLTAFLAMFIASTLATAQECDCTQYPFTPNPPCFNACVVKLSAKPPMEAASGVKNIDPGVYVGIRVLSENKGKLGFELGQINDKKGLEAAASKSLKLPN